MKCATHPEVEAVGVCVNCGGAVCSRCRTIIGGKTYCPVCATSASDMVKEKPTAKPVAGGVLGIIAGVLGLALGTIFIAAGVTPEYPWQPVDWATAGLGIALVVFGILAIIGSSFAFARKNFTRSVVGGICAVLALWPLGIPALILIVMSRDEFRPASASLTCMGCGRVNPGGARFCMNCGRELPGPKPRA
jgi:RNA polymerase subunit RPABC4/transcription elongation factor Spt4